LADVDARWLIAAGLVAHDRRGYWMAWLSLQTS
jgi:hypothetical protein